MSDTVNFLDLFVDSTGELFYLTVVTGILLASFFMASGQRSRHVDDLLASYYVTALTWALGFWMSLLAGVAVAEIGNYEPVKILPPLERFAIAGVLISIFWVFFAPPRDKGVAVENRSRRLMMFGFGVIVIAYVVSAARWWGQAGEVDFNIGVLGATWTLAISAISLLGIIVILIMSSSLNDVPLKLLFFLFLAFGNIGTLIQIAQGNIIGDYAGSPRIAFALALLIVPLILYRGIIARLSQDAAVAQAELLRRTANPPAIRPVDPVAVSAPRPIERESMHLLKALGIILENASPETIPARVIHAVHDVMKGDIVALFRQNDANYVDVVYAYDFPRDTEIDGISLNLENQSTLVNSIERLVGSQLSVEANESELRDLYTRLDVDQTGPAFFQPLIRERRVVGILLVANPYSDRELSEADESLVSGIGVIAAGILQLTYAAIDAQMLSEERAIQAIVHQSGVNLPDEVPELELAQQQIMKLSGEVKQLKLELDDERTRFISELGVSDEDLSVSQQMRVLNTEIAELQEERDSLAIRLQEAEAALKSAYSTTGDALFDQIVDTLQKEKAKLREEKSRLESELNELRSEHEGGSIQSVLDRMVIERSRLQVERDSAGAQLDEIRSQLRDLGIDDSQEGLAELISQLTQQRVRLQNENNSLTAERDYLLAERQELEERISQETERDERITNMERQIKNLAGDREAAFKQQEKLRAERDDLNEQLNIVKQHRARLLAQNTGYEIELQEKVDDIRQLREKIEELANDRSDLIQVRDELEAASQAAETERDQLMARMGGDRERLLELGDAGVGSLKAMITDLTGERNQFEKRLNETLKKLAAVESELDVLKRRSEIIDEAATLYKPENPALLLGLVQELRTPMTSIIGYVDLLLGESAGILGEMQRKFLQRVSSNVKRLSTMIDDLVRVTELDAGIFPFEPTAVDITSLIEDAITNASVQFREKGLVINLSLAEGLPAIHGDRDAIDQIIGQLLTNAYLVSPPNTEVSVIAHQRPVELQSSDAKVDCLYVSVTDRGGGISSEDSSRVFARKYKAENPLIQGLGDTGVGLSIAKALVEAHKGKLWLETEEHVGTTLSFALPIDQDQSGGVDRNR